MSKILRLLNKAQEMNFQGDTITSGAHHERHHEESFAEEKYESTKPGTLRKLFVALIVVLAVSTPISLMIAYVSLTRMNEVQALSEQFAQTEQAYTMQVDQLQKQMLLLNENASKGIKELKVTVADIRSRSREDRKELDELAVNQDILTLAINDLKDTNKLLLEKIIFLNEELKEIKDKIIVSNQ